MAIGKFRCIVMDVTDLERGERFWTAVTGLSLRFSGVGYPTRFSRLGDIASHSILLQLVTGDGPAPTNNAHLDLTVDDVDEAVQQALELGATLSREKRTYPLGSTAPYLEWAVMKDPFGNAFCLIKDLGQRVPIHAPGRDGADCGLARRWAGRLTRVRADRGAS